MRVRGLSILALTAAIQTGSTVSAQTPTLKTVMQQKVESAARLLGPIVTADFPLIDRYSEPLSRISATEISSWQTRPEAAYMQRAAMFLDAVQRLRKAAVAKHQDDALASYTALIQSCADCHRYVQRTKSITFQEPKL